jgi:hypothetical protein
VTSGPMPSPGMRVTLCIESSKHQDIETLNP